MSITNQRFVVAPLVQVIVAEDGGAVLLDLQTDQYLGIDQMGTLMWTTLSMGHTPQEVIHLIAECYTLESEELLQKDVFRFLQQMEAQHLLLPVQRASQEHDAFPNQMRWPVCACFPIQILPLLSQILCLFHVSEWLEAWLLLRWVHTFLLHRKLFNLASRLHMLPTKYPVTYENLDVRRLAKCVQSAAAWHPFKSVCLHQNLVLGFMLRRRAIHADLVIGVSTFPCFAHAWLRSHAEVIHWETGLGPGATLQRLHELSIIFCTEWLSHEGMMNGEKL